ncbi:hypothetical protein CAC42_3937 [Sphaceloma murrayae]|uniref:endo-1,3(4)-beta-glucanase n=1 Tax=Sphaceloma murrayae TaxID=2082308 RepID=A0A2K1QSB4_9PEZI|nr:hypothetical protein CAC42_3937 [Sphaceloma murrayae]
MACISSRNLSLIALFITLFVSSCSAGWVLTDDYNPSNFFSKFSFWTDADPTHGHVDYVDQATAEQAGLIKRRNGGIYMGVDYTNKAPNGRQSVRLTSYAKYNVGSLMILDLKHMPVGCGTWPAYWTVGPNWPAGGEIDIIEGVHNQAHNAMTLHTSEGCTINANPLMTGSIVTPNCYIKAPGQWDNAGCSISTPQTNTYGRGLNRIGGGVYAMTWQKASIRVWFFPRGAIPGDITAGKPTPAKWGKPLSQFQGGCNIPQFFKDNQIVFDTTFCGDWAGNVWAQSGCQTDRYPTCQSFVSDNPGAFKNAFWQINSLKVYTQSAAPVSSPISQAPPTTTSQSTSAYVTTSAVTDNNNPQNNDNSQDNNDNNDNNNNSSSNNNGDGNTATNNPNPVNPVVSGSLLVVPSNPTPASINNNNGNSASGTSGSSQGATSGSSSSGVSSGSGQASSSLNVVVGANGKLMLGPGKRDTGAEPEASASASKPAPEPEAAAKVAAVTPVPQVLSEESLENVEPLVPGAGAVAERPMYVSAREAPVEEHGDKEEEEEEEGENEEVLAMLEREKRRKGRHGHLKRHVRPVGARGGVFLH